MKNKVIKYLKYAFILVLGYHLTMCQIFNNRNRISNTSINKNLIDINIDNLDYDNTVFYSDIFKSFKLITLETNENCLIGQINKIELFNDTIFVLDKNIGKSLYEFDANGNFIRKIGKLGRGPGKYLAPISFAIDRDIRRIKILDNQKVLIYSMTGEFQKEIHLTYDDSPRYIESLNGITYLDHEMFQYRASSYLLSSVDSFGHTLKRWLDYRDYSKGFRLPFGTPNQFTKTSNDIKLTQPFFDTIFSISNNDVKPYISISTENGITGEEINEFNKLTNGEDISNFYWKCKKFLGVKTYLENDNLILFNFQNKGTTHTVLYSLSSKTSISTEYNLQNDLIPMVGYFPLYTAYKNYFVSVIHNRTDEFKQLKQIVNNDCNIFPQNINLDINKLTANSNPIIVIYECENNPKLFLEK